MTPQSNGLAPVNDEPESGTESGVPPRSAAASAMKRRQSSITTGDPGKQPSAYGQVQGLFNAYAPLSYFLPWETLDYVELLATYNPDYSQAVENVKMLANSGHEVMVDASSDLQQRRAKDLVEEKARMIQREHGGIDGVIDKLMDQAAVYGAMCGEWILSDAADEVIDFADINPKRIRFFWDDDEQRYVPYQKVNGNQLEKAKARGQQTINNHIRLNELTFHYYAFDAAPESPYGTPPFLAALGNIAIQRDLMANMAQIVKKIGLLAMMDLSVERLTPKPGEADDVYIARAQAYLSEYAEVAEDMAREGGLVHFDDVTVTTSQLGGNAAGATNIHKANEEMIFSGLKSMPSVQGRSYSTTETYAGVAYDIIIRNTHKYQRAAKRMMESGYWLMVQLGGLNPDSISLRFNENRSINRAQEAAAEKTELANIGMKWIMGFIDQNMAAQEAGYSTPATPMDQPPEAIVGSLTAHDVDTEPVTKESDFDSGTHPSTNMEDEPDG